MLVPGWLIQSGPKHIRVVAFSNLGGLGSGHEGAAGIGVALARLEHSSILERRSAGSTASLARPSRRDPRFSPVIGSTTIKAPGSGRKTGLCRSGAKCFDPFHYETGVAFRKTNTRFHLPNGLQPVNPLLAFGHGWIRFNLMWELFWGREWIMPGIAPFANPIRTSVFLPRIFPQSQASLLLEVRSDAVRKGKPDLSNGQALLASMHSLLVREMI